MVRTLASLIAALFLFMPAFAQSLRTQVQIFRMLDKADWNGDGDVTRQEFKDYRANEFPRLNRNQDNYISKVDIPLVDPDRVAVELSESLISDFDTDGDGKVSRREFDAGPTLTFNRIDTDGNGIASRYEIAAARAAVKSEAPADNVLTEPLQLEPNDLTKIQPPTGEPDERFARDNRSPE